MITKLQVKYIQSLGQKKFRDQESVFVAEGPKIINELLAAHSIPQQLYATRAWMALHADALKQAAVLIEVKEAEMERISFLQTPHEVLAVFKKPPPATGTVQGGICLMLDGIQDPGNMGTLIRIADWFGIPQIICSPDCADAFAPKVVQSTMGSIVRVALCYTDLPAWVSKNSLLPLYAATLNGINIQSLQPVKEGVIVIGSESTGIRPALLQSCKHRITIPRIGRAESLNAGVAAGIILSHLLAGAAASPQD